jgi:hypothetical protein
MALVLDTTCLPFLCIGAHALAFAGWDGSTNFYLLLYPSSAHVRALSQFLLHIFLSQAELASSLCESDRGSPAIEVTSF